MIHSGIIFILVRNNKILMQQRDGNCKRYPFTWCFPGGGSEGSESDEEMLLREVKEEYNIDLDLSQCEFLMDFYDESSPVGVYVCKIGFDQEPELREGLAMKWMAIDEIEKIELGFKQQKIIPVIKKTVL